jgi:hypothetical protein
MTRRSGQPGRTVKTGGESRRDVVIAARVTVAEADAIEAKARALRISVSRLLRSAAYDDWARAVYEPPKKQRARVEMEAVRELNRVGVNLWQLVRHLHDGGGVATHHLDEAIADVRAAVARLTKEDT